MAVKVQIGNSTFFCDTPEEAVKIHSLAGNGGGTPMQATVVEGSSSLAHKQDDGTAQLFLKKLSPYAGQEVNSEEMAKIVGAKDLSGLGPKMRQLRASFDSANLVLDHFIVKRKPDAATPTSWHISKGAA
jgi:hypothetical protein